MATLSWRSMSFIDSTASSQGLPAEEQCWEMENSWEYAEMNKIMYIIYIYIHIYIYICTYSIYIYVYMFF